ncbi:MAG: sigma 54-interacting transcriptional regulator [Thermoguttaceae bacterium]
MVLARLIFVQPEGSRTIYTLDPEIEMTLGRSSECGIVLLDERSSRVHAKIWCSRKEWFIQDLGSRNGTFVDGRLCSQSFPLFSGCEIKMGHSTCTFDLGESPDAPSDTPLEQGTDSKTKELGQTGTAPQKEGFDPTTIIHRREQTSFLQELDAETALAKTTKLGHGAADLCRLAFSLGKATEIEALAGIALKGLLSATEGVGAGLWLFPRVSEKRRKASDLRLTASATRDDTVYVPLPELLGKTVLDRKEAVLVNERRENTRENGIISRENTFREQSQQTGPVIPRTGDAPWEGGELNNTLAAPIRDEANILGLIHLYTTGADKNLVIADLEYALAVADTVAVALGQLNRQKELAENLNQIRGENMILRDMLHSGNEIVGISPAMKKIEQLVNRVSPGKATLLIRGESGTGKELIARAVHLASTRRDKPLVCLNCAAISESLLESELFGHEKGSFTGATDRKSGKFEAAHLGTLFLDEIGEMTPMLQSKFLRVLEGHPFERVGGNIPVLVDVRVIAATNRDLEKEVAAGRFRHDLFFRLRVLEIVIPPLRKRTEDIIPLAEFFLDRYSHETGRKFQGFSPEAQQALLQHRWPGNVRELKNVVERAVVLSSTPWIQAQDFLLSSLNTTGETDVFRGRDLSGIGKTETFVPLTLVEVEKLHIQRMLNFTQWNKSLTAKNLGIERTTLDRKIKQYGLQK